MNDLAVAEPQSTGLRALHGLPFWQVPIIINSFNRLSSLRRLVNWLLRAGHGNLHIIDNASSYPPLLSYLTGLEQSGRATVTRLAENAGPLALWQQSLLARLGIETEYVYTDPDVVPIECCPRDLVGVLQSVLDDNPDVAAAGVGLRLDDLPDAYAHKAQAIAWERQFWLRPAASGLFHAPIDTTMALYRPHGGHSGASPTIRSGWPYLAAHEGWYLNQAAPSEEDLFYNRAAAPGISHWSVAHVPAWLQAAAAQQARLWPSLLHVGSGGMELPGYLSVPTDGRVPLADGSVDGIYVDSSLERLTTARSLVSELARVARPGARMVLHPRLLTPRQLIDVLAQTSPLADGWRLDRVTLAVDTVEKATDAAALAAAIRRDPAVVRRMMAHLLRAEPQATAPALAPQIQIGEIDRWAGFATAAAGPSG